MSENHALVVLNARMRDCQSIIKMSQSELKRLKIEADEKKRVITQKTEQLMELIRAVKKLERL